MIDEKVLIERLEEEKSDWNCDYNVPINKAIKIVKDLASEHNNGWIPIKKELPEVNKNVLFLTSDGLVRQGVRHISYEHNRYDLYGTTHIYWDCGVIAWHPLPPAPYKKGE